MTEGYFRQTNLNGYFHIKGTFFFFILTVTEVLFSFFTDSFVSLITVFWEPDLQALTLIHNRDHRTNTAIDFLLSLVSLISSFSSVHFNSVHLVFLSCRLLNSDYNLLQLWTRRVLLSRSNPDPPSSTKRIPRKT